MSFLMKAIELRQFTSDDRRYKSDQDPVAKNATLVTWSKRCSHNVLGVVVQGRQHFIVGQGSCLYGRRMIEKFSS